MTYVGQQPATTFDSGIQDRFTGLTTNTVTLNHEISAEEDILVVWNNIVQDKNTYSVGGTGNKTVTLGGTLVSADVVTVYYTNKVMQSVNPTAGSVTSTILGNDILSGQTDIGADIADADLFLVDDGAGGTVRKSAASRLKTYITTPVFAVSGTDSQTISDATYTKVTFNAEDKDTDSAFDLTNERFTVPTGKGGTYTFQYSCQNTQKSAANVVYQVVLYKNNSLVNGTLVRQNPSTTGTYDVFLNGSATLVLSAADYIEVFYYQNRGGTVDLEANKRRFSGFRVTSL